MRPRFGGFTRALLLSALVLGAGCAPHGLYDWGGYEQGLRAQLIDDDPERARAAIEETLAALQQGDPRRIPPGLYADRGFLLYQRGDYPEAIASFRREAELFPEAQPLMEKLIARVEARETRGTPRPAELRP